MKKLRRRDMERRGLIPEQVAAPDEQERPAGGQASSSTTRPRSPEIGPQRPEKKQRQESQQEPSRKRKSEDESEEASPHKFTALPPDDGLDLDVMREIAMIREPLLPVLKNLKAMREVALTLHDLEYEAGRLAEELLENTHGGRELPEFALDPSEFMGIKMPYRTSPKEPKSSNPNLANSGQRGLGSCEEWPPATDDARPGPLYHEEPPETGPEAKPKPRHPVATWERQDYWQSKYVTTAPSGPDWSTVTRRRVHDLDSEELLEDIIIDPNKDEQDYQYDLDNIQRNLRTELVYKGPAPDVFEVYSPPRIAEVAAKLGLKPGASLDLTVTRKDGEHWDFSRKRHRDEATQMIVSSEPFCLIGSPPCTMFSILQNGNKHRFTKAEWKEKMQKAEVHIRFCISLYEIQRRAGRYYLHEHPRTATSWSLKCMGKFERYVDTIFVDADLCQFGLVTNYKGEKGLVKKPTTFMTNSVEIAARLNRNCSIEHRERHRHIAIWGERARLAQIYPPGLCRAVAEGIKAQKVADEDLLCGMDLCDIGIEDDEIMPIDAQHDPDEFDHVWAAWDDVTGKELKPSLVKAARTDEMAYVKKMGVYDVKPKSLCWQLTGAPPIRSRWVDINKGDDNKPNYRSRWVAQQIRQDNGQWELFAGTPPLEAIRYLTSICASIKGNRIMTNDISRAYFFADVKGDVFVELPKEAEFGDDPSKCAKLKKALYGTRAAASSWADCYTEILVNNGFRQGKSSPCLFFNEQKAILTLVHGDDFMSTGSAKSLEWLEEVLKGKLEVKTEVLGPAGESRCKEQIRFLNRVLSWESGGIRYEADPRHAEIIINQLGLSQTSKSVGTPGVPPTAPRNEDDAENPLLAPAEASAYRGLAARANFLSLDRFDLQYASKELSRFMAAPRVGDWELLMRFGRYLLRRPRATLFYAWQSMPTELVAFSDTDWAGCKSSRRSTSGGMIMHGSHLVRSWSRMQNLVALSSAEAELYGTVRASTELLGCRSLARDFGQCPAARLYADAGAALGIIHRQGLGKVRHLDTNCLWVQQAARAKVIAYLKVVGTANPADILTKHLPEEPRGRHASRCALEFLEGRPGIAPEVCAGDLQSLERTRKPSTTPTRARIPPGKGMGGPPKPRGSWADATEEELPEHREEDPDRERREGEKAREAARRAEPEQESSRHPTSDSSAK